MAFKSVALALIVEDDLPPESAIDYAAAFCEMERAHLACKIMAPILDLPTGHLALLAQAVIDQANDDRLKKAAATEERLKTSARLSGITVECRTIQKRYGAARAELITAARSSDLVVLPQAKGVMSSETGLIEGVLFGSGRPVLVIPTDWTRGPQFKRIVVAWDGGARAARAVGDALPLLTRADEVEVICVVADGSQSAAGAEVSEHLARHCGRVRLTDLPIQHADAGWTLRNHVDYVRPDLLVMGAYGHLRVWQFVLGGVTSLMLSEASLPVLYSY